MINEWHQSLKRRIMSCVGLNPPISLANAHKSCSFIVMLSCNILSETPVQAASTGHCPPLIGRDASINSLYCRRYVR